MNADLSDVGPSLRIPLLDAMCGICQLCAMALLKLQGHDPMYWFYLGNLAPEIGHDKFHQQMVDEMKAKRFTLNPMNFSQITFERHTPRGVELSKITGDMLYELSGDNQN